MLASRYAVSCASFLTVLSLSCTVSVMAAEIPASTPTPQTPSVVLPVKAPESSPAVGPVATVNGVAITGLDLKRANKVILQGQKGAVPTAEQMKELEKQAINQLISAELLYQTGQKMEIKDIDAQVAEKLKQGKSKFGSEEEFLKAIKELDMSESDLKDYTKKDLIITNFVEKTLVPKVSISEDDARKFYEQNLDKFTRGETMRASHILIGTDAKTSAEDKKRAYEKAEKLRKDLAGGADFATLAKENSTCPSSKQGGDLGYFGKGQMVKPFEDAASALKPGQISDVVETQFGYHVIKLVEKKASEKVDFKEVRQRIEEYLKNQKIGVVVGEYLNEARKTAKIEILYK